MRRLILLGLLAATILPAHAVKRMTVAQLRQVLSAEISAHRPDVEIARKLGELELSERLTEAALNRFAANLPLEPRTALALRLLADQSAFFDPPADELPATAFPDAATQLRMLNAARGYVAETVPELPNFFATRTTNRFDDSPQALVQGDWLVRAGLHLAGATSREITFRDGKEVQDAAAIPEAGKGMPGAKAQQELGLHTWGEFGPELAVVLGDTAKGTVAFHHWEQGPAGLAAVYRYSVPKAASHYAVNYCCLRDTAVTIMRQAGGRRDATVQMPNSPGVATKPYSETPGYHGSMAIDPATGAIVRVTLEAELSGGDPLLRAATVVEYGHVMIGDRAYVCPVRSLAFSMEESSREGRGSGGEAATGSSVSSDLAWGNPAMRPANTAALLLNETSFTRYHRLGSTIRVIADAASQAPGPPETPNGGGSNLPASGSVAPGSVGPGPATASGTQPTAAQQAANLPPTMAAQAEPPMAPAQPSQPVIPEISLSAAEGVPDQPANVGQARTDGYQLKLTSRLVDVGIVAYDKKGHPVKDLNAEDFEVFDNGRKQEIRYFSKFAGQAEEAPAAAPGAERTYSNRAGDAAAGAPANHTADSGATVLLLDESHIAWADLVHARQEILRFLGTLGPGERVGLYTINRTGFRVLEEITADRAALTARLQRWMPTAQSALQAQADETRNRQSFNDVHSVADLNSVNGNQTDVPDAASTTDPLLRTLGSSPARDSLILLTGVARHLSSVAGHKNLVWVSSDNVFADWENQAVGIDKSPQAIGSFALHAQEAMNDAHVAVFPMDVSQLEAATISADIRTRNVELNQAAADQAALNPAGSGESTARNMTPGRIKAEMQQDMRPIQGPIRQVADATGGRVIRRAGDLAAQLAAVVEDGHAAYMVSFSPQGPADGNYHAITVKLAGKHNGLTLRYRTGYIFAKEPATLKDRFREAVWKPVDVSEISVTAGVAPMSPGANVKISILAGDLGLQQQAGRWMDKLDIFFIQRDDAGMRAQVEGQTLGLRLKSSTYQDVLAEGVPFEHFVQLKPGMASLRVLVVDENSGRMGSVTIPGSAIGVKQ